jgi:exo-beta-1,3-glucanase (GH17 family)/cellulose synthase/poly-beta-1,6-N-acetylglucosamine synthase-like glycosyltransferase
MRKITNIIIILAVAVIGFSFWSLMNKPEVAPSWPGRIQGFSFSPMRAWNNPIEKKFPTETEIEEDLKLLAKKTNAVRTYSVESTLAAIPVLAKQYDLNVSLGAWLGPDLEANEEQIATVIRVARENYRNVVRVFVGSESLYREDITVKQLIDYIERVQAQLQVPVSTAEPWHIWIKYPELGSHVDFIGTHMLPYWEGVEMEQATDYIIDKMDLLKKTFPDKPVIIAEVGWPSNGRTRNEAVASEANQALFLRHFLKKAEKLDYIYYVMEAFDQPWKRKNEGSVGCYWGVYNLYRQPKFPFKAPIVGVPEWRVLAGISIVIAVITLSLLLIDSISLGHYGRGFLAGIAFLAASGAVWIVYSYSQQYLTVSIIIVGCLMLLGITGVAIVLMTEAHEWAEAIWTTRMRRPLTPVDAPEESLPMVSIHVPAYNEPPDMMIETLNALAALDYRRFEVIVMDNNTPDPAVWQPVEEHCRKLGPKFRFFHEGQLKGFKAGALNYCLKQTAPDAEVIAVIDSDYMVTSDWLKDLVPQFLKPSVAIVQAPQDYRDEAENLFKAMCYAEYCGFFHIGMVTRNERNAIIQHGTMTMVRRSVLEEVGGWAEWCITEDAELGLRIFEKGYEALYTSKSYGRGVMPDVFTDFKKQRYRWAYGAIQIMRYHAGELLGKDKSRLTVGQRYHFIAGWLPWIADSINLFFTFAALFWSIGMIYWPKKFDPPMVILSSVPLVFFVFKLAKMFYLYRNRVGATLTQTLASALAGLSLSHTIAKSIFYGFITRNLPFFRTPKMVGGKVFWNALQSAREEGLMFLALLFAAGTVIKVQGTETTDVLVWVAVLMILSIPYCAAVAMSWISAFSRLSAQKLISSITAPPAMIAPMATQEQSSDPSGQSAS